jgi:MFS family permease
MPFSTALTQHLPSTLYVVLLSTLTTLIVPGQLVIMNASSFVGRLFPGLVLHRLGVKPMIVVALGCGAVLILAMIAIHNIASVVTIGVLYGFSAGCSEFVLLVRDVVSQSSVVTLMGPLIAVLTDDMSELGCATFSLFCLV